MPADTDCKTEFSILVTEYLKHHTKYELADEMECIPNTILRYAQGLAKPLPRTMRWAMDYINKLRQEENW